MMYLRIQFSHEVTMTCRNPIALFSSQLTHRVRSMTSSMASADVVAKRAFLSLLALQDPKPQPKAAQAPKIFADLVWQNDKNEVEVAAGLYLTLFNHDFENGSYLVNAGWFPKWEITMILMLKMIQFLKRRLEIVEFPQAPKVSSELKTKAEWREQGRRSGVVWKGWDMRPVLSCFMKAEATWKLWTHIYVHMYIHIYTLIHRIICI